MKKIIFILSFFLIIIVTFSFKTYTAKVKWCIDGDSFFLTNGKEIRLAEVDAPEATNGHIQAYGLAAKEFTRVHLLGRVVKLKVMDTDRYGRSVCKVYIDSIYFNEELVKAGLCWVYPQYASRKMYLEELTAKKNKIGLWADSNPLAPYLFRRIYKQLKK